MNAAQKQGLAAALAVLAVVGVLGTSYVAQAVFALSGLDLGAFHYVFTFAWLPHAPGAALNFDQAAIPFIGLDIADFLAILWTAFDFAWMVYLARHWK